MKVFYSGNSPYARRVRIAARESGLGIEEVDVAPLSQDDHVLLAKGPGGKVPGLETDSGTYVCETLIITNYLNDKSGGKLGSGEDVMELEAIGSLLMDSLFERSHEKRREEGEPSPMAIAKESRRASRCYDALEARLAGKPAAINLGTIAAVASLGYADWRHADDEWRKGRDGLAAWFDEMMKIPSVGETAPVF